MKTVRRISSIINLIYQNQNNEQLKALVACESSGVVREALKKKGVDATSCDLLDTEILGKHYKGDVLDILYDHWDLIIAHPPCTYITNSGVRWLYNEDGSENIERWEEMRKAVDFFKLFINHPCKKILIENPIPHGHALKLIGKRYSQIIQPWQFGHGETKATCLWLKGLPLLQPTNIVEGREQRIWKLPPGPDRWKERSKTYQGIADAIADQFTNPYSCQLELSLITQK